MEVISSHTYSANEPLKLLIQFLFSLKNNLKPLAEDEKRDLSSIIDEFQSFPHYPYPRRVSQIINAFCQFHNQPNFLSGSNKYSEIIFTLMSNVPMDFYYETKKNSIAENMLHVIENGPHKIDKKIIAMENFLSILSEKADINQLTTQWEGKKSPFIYYFLGLKTPPEMVNIIFQNHAKYKIDLAQNDMFFLRYIVANFHFGERLTNKENMFFWLSDDLLSKEFNVENQKTQKSQLLNRVLLNSSMSFINYIIENCQNIIERTHINSSDIVRNCFLNYDEKIKLLQYFKCKEVNEYEIYHAVLMSNENEEGKVRKFLGYCYENFDIKPTFGMTLNHLVCDYTMLNKPHFLESFILPMNITHTANLEGDYPIHVLLKNMDIDAKKSSMRLLNYFKEKEVDFHVKDKNQNNTLHLAILSRQTIEVVGFLMDEKVSLIQKNNEGLSAFSLLSDKLELYSSLIEKATSYYEKELFDSQITLNKSHKKHKI